MTLTLAKRPWVKVIIRLCDILSRSNMAARSYGPDTALGMCALWPWHGRYDHGSRSWHTLESWTISVWNIIQIQLGSDKLLPEHRFSIYVHCHLVLGDMTFGQGHDTPLDHGQQLCEILSRSNLAVRNMDFWYDFWYVSTVCDLDLGDMTLVQGHDTLGSWTTIVWNIIQIQLGSEELWHKHGFWVCVHCDLDLKDMTLSQGHDTPLGHGQQVCEILSRSDKWLRSYDPDTDRQRDRQMDRQTGWFLYNPKTLFAGEGVYVMCRSYM